MTTSIAAVLVSQAMNVGMRPMAAEGEPALALDRLYWVEQNYLRAATLLDPAARVLLNGAEANVGGLIASLRAAAGADVDDPRLTELVGELCRRLWARHDVRPQPGGGTYHVQHPQVGEIELRYDKFVVSGAEDQLLVVYQAEPASRSAEALALLSALADADSWPNQ
jgi:hypothetical protein